MNNNSDYTKYLSMPIRTDRKPLQELLPLNHPLRVLIDPSDICNFRCDFCFQSKKEHRGTIMTRETFESIIRQLSCFPEKINVVHLYGLGEPMVNNDLPLYVERLKEAGVAKEVAITSNGSLLTKNMADRLAKSPLDRLSISLNGICDEHFSKHVGVSVNFDKIYNQIKYFYSIRGNCHLHVKINGDFFSESEKKKFVELFKDCSDSINIDHIVNVWPDMKVIETENRMYDYDIGASLESKSLVCPLMFYELLVHSDGSVSPCAVDYGFNKQNLGNIQTTSLLDIWNGQQLRKIRIQALKGEVSSYHMCNACDYANCAATVNITPFRNELINKY